MSRELERDLEICRRVLAGDPEAIRQLDAIYRAELQRTAAQTGIPVERIHQAVKRLLNPPKNMGA
jgi:hypothetical protein